jgi:hypothetical protein
MSLGFIILRHVNSYDTDKYWIECYSCIRALYPSSKIMIIDDNSNYIFVSNIFLTNTLVIESEYKGRGELLPYIYYLKHKLFDTAVIIHDSVFIKKHIDFTQHINKSLWDFEHEWDEELHETTLITLLNNWTPLMEHYKSKSWKGCFGAMTVIGYNFLEELNKKYNIHNLIPYINSRSDRMAFERVIAVLIDLESPSKSILGNIHKYIVWGYSYNNYLSNNLDIPVFKIWTGR